MRYGIQITEEAELDLDDIRAFYREEILDGIVWTLDNREQPRASEAARRTLIHAPVSVVQPVCGWFGGFLAAAGVFLTTA